MFSTESRPKIYRRREFARLNVFNPSGFVKKKRDKYKREINKNCNHLFIIHEVNCRVGYFENKEIVFLWKLGW